MTSVFDGHTAVEHAETAAAAIRAINHLTYHDTALPYPSDAWRLIGELGSLAYRLRQALEQTATLIRRQHESGLVGVDAGTVYAGDAAGAVRDTVAALDGARAAAIHLADALEQAQQPLTYAHYTGPLDDEDDDGAVEATR
jgi:hypothetical protein